MVDSQADLDALIAFIESLPAGQTLRFQGGPVVSRDQLTIAVNEIIERRQLGDGGQLGEEAEQLIGMRDGLYAYLEAAGDQVDPALLQYVGLAEEEVPDPAVEAVEIGLGQLGVAANSATAQALLALIDAARGDGQREAAAPQVRPLRQPPAQPDEQAPRVGVLRGRVTAGAGAGQADPRDRPGAPIRYGVRFLDRGQPEPVPPEVFGVKRGANGRYDMGAVDS